MLTSDNILKPFLCQFKMIAKKYSIFIYGIGAYGTFLAQYFQKHQIDFSGFVETIKKDDTYMGKEIYCVSDVPTSGWFLISSYRHNDEMKKNLIINGISEDQITLFPGAPVIYDAIIDVFEPTLYTQKLRSFKNLHEGARCFIVGNGPSLRVSDLDKLKKSITMGCNNIFQVYDQTKWRPTYYFEIDIELSKQLFYNKKFVEYVCSNCKAVFTGIWANLYQYRNDSMISNLFFFSKRFVWNDKPEFSHDVSCGVYEGHTVVYDMLQFAAYMGFREIYLIGVDQNYVTYEKDDGSLTTSNENKRNHAEFMDDTVSSIFPKVDKMRNAFLAARIYAEANGIKIYNATRGGKLEIFERVDFDSLF